MQGAGDQRRWHGSEDGGPGARGRVVSALFFFPRGGSAQVARAFARALPAVGWQTTLAAGSLGRPGEETNAAELSQWPRGARSRLHARARASRSARSSASLSAVLRGPAESARPRLRDCRRHCLRAAGRCLERGARGAPLAGEADVLHVHHLTPANEAAIRCFPSLPILGHLHGTEPLSCERSRPGAPAGWRYAARWAERLRGWV